MQFYEQHISDVLKQLQTQEEGLQKSEVLRRQKQFGKNQIKIRGEPLWRKLVEPFANVFMGVLLIAAVISLYKDEVLDAVIIIAIMTVSAIIYYIQRFSTERILRALQKHVAEDVQVIRSNQTISVDATELVPGDIIILTEGQKVPADARLMHTENVRVDESMLTGESVPVSKQTMPLQNIKQVYEQNNMVFQGSFIIAGQALAAIVTTGNNTEYGKLAKLSGTNTQKSPVQQKIDKLLSQIVIIVVIVAAAAFSLSILRGLPVDEAVRFVLTLSVSAVPEGLPVAITVILVLGMRRLAKKKALVRSMAAIENIGVITTIATDKTGTLTKNKLSVINAFTPDGTEANENLQTSAMLSVNQSKGTKLHDPLDTAIQTYTISKIGSLKQYKLMTSIPFEHQFAMSGNVWQIGNKYELHLKGAPERVIAHSTMNTRSYSKLEKLVHSLTGQGFRVIAIAKSKLDKPIDSMSELKKKDTELLGILAIADVLRPEAKPAIAAAHSAGVSVRMITGDHFETAYSIGKQLGMAESKEFVFDSRKVSKIGAKQLTRSVKNSFIFARVIPEDKFKILSVLKKTEITAMTGDGVNDVPALTNAHVGIAMGSGSQIAKEAGNIVLLDNNFKSIITAMHEGRIIDSNIRRMLYYLLSTNAGQIITLLLALIIGLPLPLVAVQILWINLITDTLFVIPLGLEPGEKDVMSKPPRSPNSPILDRFTIVRMLFVATTMAVLSLVIFTYFNNVYNEDYARTITFAALVVMQWANAFNARSERHSIFSKFKVFNGKFYIGLSIAVILQALALFGPLQAALNVTPVALQHLIYACTVSIIAICIVSEIYKLVARLRQQL